MDRSMGMLVALAAVVLMLAGPAAAVFDGYDGMPRPNGTDYEPTTTYGPSPAVKYKNSVAKCIWYGWENVNYPPDAVQKCSSLLWASLSASNPAGLSAYMYYVPQDSEFYDPQYEEYLCAIGCFDLSAASPDAAPSPSDPTPAADPPATTAPPSPAATAPPPPATLFQPPPPLLPVPPTSALAPTLPAVTPSPTSTPPLSTPASSSPASLSPPTFLPPAFGPSVARAPASNVPIDSAASSTAASTLLLLAATLFLTMHLLT